MRRHRAPRIQDAVLEAFPVILAARRLVERRRRHGRRAAAAVKVPRPAASAAGVSSLIGDAVLSAD